MGEVLECYWQLLSIAALLFASMAVSTALMLRYSRKIRAAH
ncbi:hypothetical protein DFAR_3770002 [Desulfarculales bacterium]